MSAKFKVGDRVCDKAGKFGEGTVINIYNEFDGIYIYKKRRLIYYVQSKNRKIAKQFFSYQLYQIREAVPFKFQKGDEVEVLINQAPYRLGIINEIYDENHIDVVFNKGTTSGIYYMKDLKFLKRSNKKVETTKRPYPFAKNPDNNIVTPKEELIELTKNLNTLKLTNEELSVLSDIIFANDKILSCMCDMNQTYYRKDYDSLIQKIQELAVKNDI